MKILYVFRSERDLYNEFIIYYVINIYSFPTWETLLLPLNMDAPEYAPKFTESSESLESLGLIKANIQLNWIYTIELVKIFLLL